MADDCPPDIDPAKLVREGTSQDGRQPAALDPAQAPVDGRSVAHKIVFAEGYARLLKYFDRNNTATGGDWTTFFANDVSVPLAVASIEDVEGYKAAIRSWFAFLSELGNRLDEAALRDRLGYLYASAGLLALAVDRLKESLPREIALRGTLENLIKTQLAPALARLIAYYKAGDRRGLVNPVPPSPPILRRPGVSFAQFLTTGLSGDWSGGTPWPAYVAGVTENATVYGTSSDVFERINHCATHTLFRSIFEQFLRVFGRVTREADAALSRTLTAWDKHEPHYALYLAFLQLLEYARTSANGLTGRHLDFYYRTILGFKEKPALPGHAHLVVELAKQASSRAFPAGERFKAGKDDQRKDAFFANLREMVANRAKVTARSTVYRHGSEPIEGGTLDNGRIFASTVADSDDGQGAPLTAPDQSWHPFFNKVYANGKLQRIAMREAEIGFAVASHHLALAEGTRKVTLKFTVSGLSGKFDAKFKNDVRCFLTTEKGWLEKPASSFVASAPNKLELVVDLIGADPAIVPYAAKVHGYNFQTDSPMLLVKLGQDRKRRYLYPTLRSVRVSALELDAEVANIRSLAVSNDFGSVDPSKPFQPFGASPVKGSSLVIGSKEIFQKNLFSLSIALEWLVAPVVFPSSDPLPTVSVDFLSGGTWSPAEIQPPSDSDKAPWNAPIGSSISLLLKSDLEKPVRDEPDFTANEPYGAQSRHGFVRLKLSDGVGQAKYLAALIEYLKPPPLMTTPPTNPGSTPPAGPTAAGLTMAYTSVLELDLASTSSVYEGRKGRFFHLAPFGTAEQHPHLAPGADIHLLPQFSSQRAGAVLTEAKSQTEAEFYVGVDGLSPPQNLALLFQVVDGTANPLAVKPEPHIDWSYLRNNRWVGLDGVQDSTGELLKSGIVVVAVPRDATSDNTVLGSGLYWLRAAVHDTSDAVGRLQLVAAQALEAVFADSGNAPNFSATPLPPGTVSKLAAPDAAVKSIGQPYPSFGGRGAEERQAFYTRVSERLRHKDRAIDLWDYEHLILEAFPQVYKAKCLNHTWYGPDDSGKMVYRERAPGHVTVVTIPNLKSQQQRDPLKPYTSLGVLQDIEAFLKKRTSCFARLHVRNPLFEEVHVTFGLRLRDGYDEAHSTAALQQAITRFLSPWAFAEGGVPSFGGKVYKSALIKFVEEQASVDYVTDFQLFRDTLEGEGKDDLDEVVASKAISILVSAPASRHKITVVKPGQDAELAETCGCNP
jgi:hypothetical protein